MKKSLLTLGVASTILLSACNHNENQNQKESVEEPKTEQVNEQPDVNYDEGNQESIEQPKATAKITPPEEPSEESFEPPLEEQQENYSKHIQHNPDWKEEYDSMNEGTEETPYVMVDGKPVDPKHLTTKEDLNGTTPTE